MRLLDRYILRHFVLAYVICFVCLVSLYAVIDLFSRFDEFNDHAGGVLAFGRNAILYYACRVPWFFQRLSGLITLLAALFTFTWLERQNELVAWLAAGVPVRRLLYPILTATLVVVSLTVVNQEWLIPRMGPRLVRAPDDPFGLKPTPAQGAYDANMIHLCGGAASPQRKAIEVGAVTLPPQIMGALVHLSCAEMVYRPASGTDSSGWYLLGVHPPHVPCPHAALNWLGPGTYFLHTELTYERVTRHPDWFYYASTPGLLLLLQEDSQIHRRTEVIALVHRRLTAPLWLMILVVITLTMAVGRPDRHRYWKLAMNVIINVLIQSLQALCMLLAQQNYVDPVMANWLPVLIFGPCALLLLDAMRS
jgi:lipopolysaccharide export system permease protein